MGGAAKIITLLVAACAFVCSACGSCRSSSSSTSSNREQLETLQLVRIVTELRLAPNDQKRPPLERLRSFSCTVPKVCAAKSACLDAFDHHVRGIELGHRLRANLSDNRKNSHTRPETGAVVHPLPDVQSDGQSDAQSDVQFNVHTDRQERPVAAATAMSDDEKTALLLEMNLEVEDGRRLMPRCDEAMSTLRSAAK